MPSMVLAIAMLVTGFMVATRLAAAGRAPPGIDPMTWIWISLLDLIAFAGLFVARMLNRRNPPIHERLMLFASLLMLSAA